MKIALDKEMQGDAVFQAVMDLSFFQWGPTALLYDVPPSILYVQVIVHFSKYFNNQILIWI